MVHFLSRGGDRGEGESMRLSYWIAKSTDGSAFPVRGKTRLNVEMKILAMGGPYEQPRMVTTPEFTGSYDMLEHCLDMKGPWWEDEKEDTSGERGL